MCSLVSQKAQKCELSAVRLLKSLCLLVLAGVCRAELAKITKGIGTDHAFADALLQYTSHTECPLP